LIVSFSSSAASSALATTVTAISLTCVNISGASAFCARPTKWLEVRFLRLAALPT